MPRKIQCCLFLLIRIRLTAMHYRTSVAISPMHFFHVKDARKAREDIKREQEKAYEQSLAADRAKVGFY